MKNYYQIFLGAIFFVITICTNAQPTLTGVNSNPQIGDSFFVNSIDVTGFNPGNIGANVTWNFSGLSILDTNSVIYINPSTTPYTSYFPNAIISLTGLSTQGNQTYVYYNTSSSEFLQVGVASSSGTIIPYSNSEKVLSYPFSYNSNYVDSFSSNYDLSGLSMFRHGTIAVSADAYGTLIMPYGTLNNVLRVKMVENYQDDYNGMPIYTYDTEIYTWYLPNIHYPVLSKTLYTINSTSTTEYGSYLDQSSMGINNVTNNNFGFNLYPNPSDKVLNITFSKEIQNIDIIIKDICGKVLFNTNLSSIEKHSVDVSDYPDGVYIVSIKSDNNTTTKKFMINH